MKESVFMFFRRTPETDPDEKRCAVCGVKLDKTADVCDYCLGRRKKNLYTQAGCLAVVLFCLFAAAGLYLMDRVRDGKAGLENDSMISEMAGRYVSDFDYRYIMILREDADSGDGVWDGTISFSGPSKSFNGRTLRCRVKNEKLLVELVSGGETNLVEMFAIRDGNILESRIGMHWPGVFKKILEKPVVK